MTQICTIFALGSTRARMFLLAAAEGGKSVAWLHTCADVSS